MPVMFWLDGFEKPFGAVGGEGAVGPVPDEQYVVPGEPELAVRILGQKLVSDLAEGGGDRAGHDGCASVVHEPLPGCRVQPGPQGSDVDRGSGAGRVGAGTRVVCREDHLSRG